MGGTLLLADDSITIQKVVELTFAETDHTVVAVGNGRDLLQRLPQVKPDVVLCDVVMPDMNGYDVCQSLKSDPGTLHIPVILLTGTFEPFDRDRALAAGCDAIVTKPFEARELIATVEDLLQRSMSAQGAAGDEGQQIAELGVPDGVPSLDFTTTGFEKMVPPPPKPQLPPEEGIELTSSALGRSFSVPPPPAPPELVEAPLESLEEQFAAVPEAAHEEPAAISTEAFEDAFEAPLLEEETFPSARAETPQPPAHLEPEPIRLVPAEPSIAAVAAPVGDVSSTMKIDLDAIKREAPEAFRSPEPFAPPAEPAPVVATSPVAAPPTAPSGYQPTESDIEAIVQRVLSRLPVPEAPAPAPEAPAELSDEQVRVVATKVLELAQPLIEQIAWEVVPDMAEMIVRARIRELESAAEEDR